MKRDTPSLRKAFPPLVEGNGTCPGCGKDVSGLDENKAPYEVTLWVRWPEIAGNEQPWTFCSLPCFLPWIKEKLMELGKVTE